METVSAERLRPVGRVQRGMPAEDGAGVKLSRIIGTPMLPQLDPFLLLDEFRSENPDDYIAGFPPHPHRGFETVTYMKRGNFRHKDSKGNEGFLRPGSVQWMTAGRGIIHSEMPEMNAGELWGFQLWLNLPAEHKMTEPVYQDLQPEDIPVVEESVPTGQRRVVVISGEYAGTPGGGKSFYPFRYLDLELPPEDALELATPEDHSVMLFLYEGGASLGPTDGARRAGPGELAIFGDGEGVRIQAGPEGAKLLFLSGQQLREPIARMGPFVMNTEAEIQAAIRDFQNGVLHK